MSYIVRHLWRWLYRLLCKDCDRIMWPWQAKHRTTHTACHHAKLAQLTAEATANYGVQPWACGECGWRAR